MSLSERQVVKVQRLRRKGWSLWKIATELKLTSEDVRSCLHPPPRATEPIRVREKASAAREKLRAERAQKAAARAERDNLIIACWEAGFTLAEVAVEVGASVGGASARVSQLRRAGHPLARRPLGKSPGRDENLERAKEIKRRKGEIKNALRSGQRDICDLLRAPPPLLTNIRVADILCASPYVGKVRSAQILRAAGLDPEVRFSDMGAAEARAAAREIETRRAEAARSRRYRPRKNTAREAAEEVVPA